MRRLSVIGVMALAGCATQWTNPNLSEAEQARQMKIDNGYCLSVAHGSVPMPALPAPGAAPAAPYGYNISGTASTYTPGAGYSTTNYSATATPKPGGFGTGFAQGMANAQNNMALMAVASARRDREAIIESCMLRLGWIDGADAAAVSAKKASPVAESKPKVDEVEVAINEVPRLAFVRTVDAEKFNVIAAIDATLRNSPEWKNRPMRERFEAATQTYERTAGPIYMPGQRSPLDTPDIQAKQTRLLEGYRILAELEKANDVKNADEMRPMLVKLERDIYTDRAWAKLAREHMQLPQQSPK